MDKFSNFINLHESLTTPVEFYLTDDTEIPKKIAAAFEIDGTQYGLTMEITNFKRIYTLKMYRVVNKKIRLWTFQKPSHILPCLSTILKFTETAIPFLKAHFDGVLIPYSKKKTPADRFKKMAERIIKKSYITSFRYVPVEGTGKDLIYDYVFVARKMKSPDQIFSSKRFVGFEFDGVVAAGAAAQIQPKLPQRQSVTLEPSRLITYKGLELEVAIDEDNPVIDMLLDMTPENAVPGATKVKGNDGSITADQRRTNTAKTNQPTAPSSNPLIAWKEQKKKDGTYNVADEKALILHVLYKVAPDHLKAVLQHQTITVDDLGVEHQYVSFMDQLETNFSKLTNDEKQVLYTTGLYADPTDADVPEGMAGPTDAIFDFIEDLTKTIKPKEFDKKLADGKYAYNTGVMEAEFVEDSEEDPQAQVSAILSSLPPAPTQVPENAITWIGTTYPSLTHVALSYAALRTIVGYSIADDIRQGGDVAQNVLRKWTAANLRKKLDSKLTTLRMDLLGSSMVQVMIGLGWLSPYGYTDSWSGPNIREFAEKLAGGAFGADLDTALSDENLNTLTDALYDFADSFMHAISPQPKKRGPLFWMSSSDAKTYQGKQDVVEGLLYETLPYTMWGKLLGEHDGDPKEVLSLSELSVLLKSLEKTIQTRQGTMLVDTFHAYLALLSDLGWVNETGKPTAYTIGNMLADIHKFLGGFTSSGGQHNNGALFDNLEYYSGLLLNVDWYPSDYPQITGKTAQASNTPKQKTEAEVMELIKQGIMKDFSHTETVNAVLGMVMPISVKDVLDGPSDPDDWGPENIAYLLRSKWNNATLEVKAAMSHAFGIEKPEDITATVAQVAIYKIKNLKKSKAIYSDVMGFSAEFKDNLDKVSSEIEAEVVKTPKKDKIKHSTFGKIDTSKVDPKTLISTMPGSIDPTKGYVNDGSISTLTDHIEKKLGYSNKIKNYANGDEQQREKFYALQAYTGSGHSAINSGLRISIKDIMKTHSDLTTPTAKKAFQATVNDSSAAAMRRRRVYKMMTEMPRLPEGLWVNRGAEIHENDKASFVPGELYVDPGFMSTSITAGFLFANNLRLSIYLPKGTMCIPVLNNSKHPGESEIILPPMSVFRIIETQQPQDQYGPLTGRLVYLTSAFEDLMEGTLKEQRLMLTYMLERMYNMAENKNKDGDYDPAEKFSGGQYDPKLSAAIRKLLQKKIDAKKNDK